MNIESIDNKKIEQAIYDFESEVDCEFIPVITPKSSYVEHIKWILSLLILILFLGLIEIWFYNSWESKTWFYLAAPFVSIILGSLLDKSDLVDRFCISKAERTRQVFEKAQRTFFYKRLDQVKSNNSLLLFISKMERQIVLLPDPRISRMTEAELKDLTSELLKVLQSQFKSAEFEQGILSAIELLKKRLKPRFPRTSTAENAVANRLIWID